MNAKFYIRRQAVNRIDEKSYCFSSRLSCSARSPIPFSNFDSLIELKKFLNSFLWSCVEISSMFSEFEDLCLVLRADTRPQKICGEGLYPTTENFRKTSSV